MPVQYLCVCVCVCVCVLVCQYLICVCLCEHVCIIVYMWITVMFNRVYVCDHLCMCVCVYVRVCVNVCGGLVGFEGGLLFRSITLAPSGHSISLSLRSLFRFIIHLWMRLREQ